MPVTDDNDETTDSTETTGSTDNTETTSSTETTDSAGSDHGDQVGMLQILDRHLGAPLQGDKGSASMPETIILI